MSKHRKKFILLSEKAWHQSIFEDLKGTRVDETWELISNRADFTIEKLEAFKPDKIFIPHWSYIIGEAIFSNFECVVFHMTDLPFGRGWSPLQNLIVRGLNETKISALRVGKGIDTGDIYCKQPLSLQGSALEIFERSVPVIHTMIKEIIDQNLLPVPQEGEPTTFKRRTPEQGNLAPLESAEDFYDFIRMLDCPGYPRAFLETEHMKLEFHNAKIHNDKLTAHVEFFKK